MLKRVLFLFACTLIAGSFLYAQITTSSLQGSAKDSSNNPLVGATIKATHQPTGTVYTTVSGKLGQFNIQNMRVGGPYVIEISFVGYETQRFEDVYLRLAEPFLLTTLMAKSVTTIENVVLTTTQRKNPIFNSSRTGATTNISRSQIERMPTVRRSINDLTRSAPQSYTSSDGAQIGGGNYRQNNFTIDGAEYNNSFGISSNGSGNLPGGGDPISLDALEEFSINITPFDVRQSGFIGSGINAVTRSGTNSFTGSYYQYWRNEKERGNKVGKLRFTRTPETYKLQGFRIGGPIIKNKLFFFFNYETDNTPRQLQTRFAATPAAPFGSSPNIARPTASDLQMFSDYLKATYDYDTGPFDNYILQVQHTKALGRIDWNINRNHHLMVRYGQIEGGNPSTPSTSTGGSNLVGVPGTRTDINSMYFANSIYYQGVNYYSLAGEVTSKFGKRFSNVIRGTYTYQNESRSTPSSQFPFVDILSGAGGSTYTSFGYELFSFGNLRKVNATSFIDNLTWSKGKHIVTVGAQRDDSKTINGFMRFGTSYYVFNSWNDFISGAKPYNFAVTFSFLPNFAQAFPSFKFRQWSWYAQDEITFNNRFRLTYGLRADQPGYPSVPEVKTNPFILAVTFRDNKKINTGILPDKKILWSPRIGFNWDLYGDRRLQIRGGTGVFTGKIPFVWIVSQSGDNGMLQTTLGINGTANTPGPFNPNPRAYFPSSTPVPGSIIPTTIEALTADYKFPQTWKSSLGIDTKLGAKGTTILTVEAIFNKDLHTSVFNNVNLVAPTPMNIPGYPDTRPLYPSAANNKFVNPVRTTAGQITRVDFVPNGTAGSLGAANVIEMGNGNKGYYFSLAAQLTKQIGKSLSVSLSYTKSLAGNLFDGGGDQPLSAWQGTNVGAISPNQTALSYAGYVMPDRLTASINFRKEYFKHLGTTLSIFFNAQCDGRFSYVYGTDFNNDGAPVGNDLIYIPKDPTEIDFAPFTYNGVNYSAQQQKDLFFKYIDQDKYLRAHKGQYAERNGGLFPWRSQIDAKFMQDLFVNLGKKRNTIQFSIDVVNIGNMLNSEWGKVKTLNATSGQLLFVTNQGSIVPGGTTRPLFRLATDRNNPITSTFRDNVSTTSTWFMQFGIRYIFGN